MKRNAVDRVKSGNRNAGWETCRITDQASAALEGAAERAEPEVVEAKRYSRNWRQALQRPTACRCWAALSPNWDIRVGPSDQ
jgi:hypothetical protein